MNNNMIVESKNIYVSPAMRSAGASFLNEKTAMNLMVAGQIAQELFILMVQAAYNKPPEDDFDYEAAKRNSGR